VINTILSNIGIAILGTILMIPLGFVLYLLFSVMFGGGCSQAGGTC